MFFAQATASAQSEFDDEPDSWTFGAAVRGGALFAESAEFTGFSEPIAGFGLNLYLGRTFGPTEMQVLLWIPGAALRLDAELGTLSEQSDHHTLNSMASEDTHERSALVMSLEGGYMGLGLPGEGGPGLFGPYAHVGLGVRWHLATRTSVQTRRRSSSKTMAFRMSLLAGMTVMYDYDTVDGSTSRPAAWAFAPDLTLQGGFCF